MTSNGFACGDCRPDFRPLTGTTNDLSVTFAYNPASQITQAVRTGDAYAYTAMGNGSTSYTQNGLNQQITVGGSSTAHDANGNLTTEPQSGKTYSYDAENRLKTASGGVSVYYDPLGRIAEYDTTVSSRFMSDGAEVAVEVDNPGSNIVRRFVRGDGPDELIAWYEGSGTTSRRFAGLDERGSVISATDGSGTLVGINAYDEYGKPAGSNIGRMQYTGQMWLPEASLYYYKARMYAAQLGRFVQPDPIGVAGGMNLYAYVLTDPVSLIDPLGLDAVATPDCDPNKQANCSIIVTAQRICGASCAAIDNSLIAAWSFPLTYSPPDAGIGGGGGGDTGSKGCPLATPTGNYKTLRTNGGGHADPRFTPELAAILSSVFAEVNKRGIVPEITSGFRTRADQNRMIGGGSGSRPAASTSLHQIGQAVDFNTQAPGFGIVRAELRKAGLTWGGTYATRKDFPHFQIPPAGTRTDPRAAANCEAQNPRR